MLKVAADGFVKLLQMAVLPYITISIITSLGTLRYDQAKTLGLRAGAVLGGLWCIALLFAFLIPVAFPEIETASFFSTTLVGQRQPFNFIDIFIPSNPFNSLANNVVPAVVLFSVFLGIALIGVERKQILPRRFGRRQRRPIECYKFIVTLTPLRHLCHRRQHSGNVKILEQLGRIQAVFDYLRAHGVARRALWVLPGLVAALPLFAIGMCSGRRGMPLITAFMAAICSSCCRSLSSRARSCCSSTGPPMTMPPRSPT